MSEPSMLDRLQTELVAAMKSKDAPTLSTVRMLKTALMEAKTRKAKDETLSAAEEIEILQRYVKKRREAIEEWKKAGRADLVENEEREIAVTQRFLPAALGEDELRRIVADIVAASGAASPKDMGRVIGAVMGRVKGQAEGAVVSRLVKEALGG
jgi:uncharacterized protein YqeY